MNKTKPAIGQRDFFALPEVVEQQQIQKSNPYGSKPHKAAWDKLCEIARSYGVQKYFTEY